MYVNIPGNDWRWRRVHALMGAPLFSLIKEFYYRIYFTIRRKGFALAASPDKAEV